ncbi:MAG: AMP-binding protein, partial [Saccharothrix sp.]|nr:AMP-binding protein [Saccharothrix sp.]
MTPTRTAPVTSAPADDVDPALLAEIAAAAGAVPGVREAVAVVRRSTRTTTTATAPVTTPASPSAPTDKPSSHVDGGPLRIPDGAPTTLQDALRQAAELAPGKGTTYLRRGEAVLQTYPRLLAEAERVLAGLRAAGLRPGDAALFQFEDNRDYLTAFWACVLGGFVPTPVAVAPTYTEHNATNRRLHNAWTLLDRPVVLTGRATATALAEVRGLWDEPDVRVLVVQDLLRHAPDTHWHPTTADSPVLNLLTSGSTGVPKCVQHTNASVAARTWACAQERGYGPDDVTVNWMPLDHVAIVMYNVRDVFLRCSHVNAAVDDFLADPLSWLDWLDRFGATNTWAPNFAFAMVNDHAEEIGRRRWDLSRLRAITNAAEPVIAATTHRFLDLLAPHGLPPDAMWPGWGMSETCSVVTYVKQSRDDHAAGVVAVAQSSLGGDLVEVEPDDPDAVVFSEAGPPVPGVSMRVVAPDGSVLPEDALGELQVRGATMMTGYHANPEANRESYDADGWFRTGDLAFVHRGSVVIAGRKKDQIVIRGINYIAHEIESVVERVDGVRLTHVAATGVREPGEGSDRLVLFFVPQRWDDRLEDTVQAVREALVREVGPAPDLVVPVTAAEFPKTGSGKIQRGALVADLRAGRFADRVRSAERGSDDPVDWSFVRRWHPVGDDVPAAPAGGVSVVLADDEVWEHLADAFADGRAVVVRRGEGFAEDGPDRFRVAPGDAEGLGRVLDLAARRHGPVTTIVSAWSLRTATAPPRPVEAATDLAALL